MKGIKIVPHYGVVVRIKLVYMLQVLRSIPGTQHYMTIGQHYNYLS